MVGARVRGGAVRAGDRVRPRLGRETRSLRRCQNHTIAYGWSDDPSREMRARSDNPARRRAMAADPEHRLPALERSGMEARKTRDRAPCARIPRVDIVPTSARGAWMPAKDWLGAALGPFPRAAIGREGIRVRPSGHVAIGHARPRPQASEAGRDWSGLLLLPDARAQRGEDRQVVACHETRHLIAAKQSPPGRPRTRKRHEPEQT